MSIPLVSIKLGLKNCSLYILSFVIPFILVCLSYCINQVTPFGDNTLFIVDGKELWLSDLAFLKRLFRGEESFFYSFEIGLGLNLMGMNSSLLNPTHFLVPLFNIESIPELYTWLAAINTSLSGLTMFIFLKTQYKGCAANIIFSTIYSLCGFNASYFFIHYFIFPTSLLPLIALGIKQITEAKFSLVYLISLFVAILNNFFFGYILCIASCILFFMWYCEKKMASSLDSWAKRKIVTNFLGSSIAAGLLAAIAWVPAILTFIGGRVEQNSFSDFTLNETMTLAQGLAKFFVGATNSDQIINGQPNIFCTTIVVFLVVLFFTDKTNCFKIKLTRAIPLAFYFISFYITAFSMAMQGFIQTNWFNFRYSFVFSFLLIIVARAEFEKIKSIDSIDFRKSCYIFFAIVAIVFSHKFGYVTGGTMLFSVLVLILCVIAISWTRVNEQTAPMRHMLARVAVLCAVECLLNHALCIKNLIYSSLSKTDFCSEIYNETNKIHELIKGDAGFYRLVEDTSQKRELMASRFSNYNGINYFGSNEKNWILHGLSNLGVSWFVNRLWYATGEPEALDALLGIKYIISKNDLSEQKSYQPLGNFNNLSIYRNDLALPIGFLAENQIQMVSLSDSNPFENHNTIWKTLTGEKANVFSLETKISFTFHANHEGLTFDYEDAKSYSISESKESIPKDSIRLSIKELQNKISDKWKHDAIINSGRYIECSFIAHQDGNIYSYTGSNEKKQEDLYNESREKIKYLGKFKKGDIVTDFILINGKITKDKLKSICSDYYVAYADVKALEAYTNKLQETAGSLRRLSDTHLTGTINPTHSGRLFFTIPYDNGWSLLIDGAKAPLEKTFDLFMSAPISQGHHKYELRFFPSGLTFGLYVSLVGLVLLFILIFYNKRISTIRFHLDRSKK